MLAHLRWKSGRCLYDFGSIIPFQVNLWEVFPVFSQEGDTINVDVTCPGATLALAMIYLKTNNRY